MNESECSYCGNIISDDSEYCAYCGALFLEDVKCTNHESNDAIGVCLICQQPFCNQCAKEINKIVLCNDHANYEIYEGMVRVFGSNDTLEIEYSKDCLEKAGFHPMIFSRKVSPLSLGGPDYSLFRASGEYRSHLINEIKLLVPSTEILEAEKTLKELEILE